jgi:hypothetical protein
MTSTRWTKAMLAYSPSKIVAFLITKVIVLLLFVFTLVLSFILIEDELQNVEMAEEERTRKNNELKIKKRDYTGYDDEEFTEGNQGMKRSVLAKYDEDIEGIRETVSLAILSSFSLIIHYRVSDWAVP